MNKSLPIIAALLGWTAALAAISGFEAMDAERNGTISTQVHTAAAQSMFQAMDANGDGRVTAAEMHAAQGKAGLDAGHAMLNTQ